MTSIIARDVIALAQIFDLVCEHSFDLKTMRVADGALWANVSDRPTGRRAAKDFPWRLGVQNVVNVRVDDRARIGYYSLESLEYFEDLSVLLLQGIEIMSIRIEVSELHGVLEYGDPPDIPMSRTETPPMETVWRRLTSWSR